MSPLGESLLKTFGDKPGHAFHGNQWKAASDAAWNESAKANKAGTPAAHLKAVNAHLKAMDKAAGAGKPDFAEKHRAAADSHSRNYSEASDMSDKLAMLAHGNSVRGIEIFDIGKHNGDKYTEADLDSMVDAFKVLDYRPSVKIGHTKDYPGAPSFGWVTNLKKVGTKILADFESMHDSVIAALKDRRYDRVSSEVYFNLDRGGKKYPRALKAVALLGAEVPAVAGLVPLHKMEFAETGDVQNFDQALEIANQAFVDTLSERVAALTQLITQGDSEMKVSQATIKLLSEQVKGLTTDIETLKKSDDKDKDAKVKVLADRQTEIQTSLDELNKLAAQDTDADDVRKLAEANARIALLEQNERKRNIEASAGKLKVPAFGPEIEALYAHAYATAGAKVKFYAAADKEGKRAESEMGVVDVVDNLVKQINANAEKLFKTLSTSEGRQREEGDLNDAADAGAAVDAKAQEYLRKHPELKGDYATALDAVAAEHPALYKKYVDEQSAGGKVVTH